MMFRKMEAYNIDLNKELGFTHLEPITKNNEIIKLCVNGDIFVKGKLIENDKEVVDAMKEFLKTQGYLDDFIPERNC
jgi:hypothetical protein